MSLQGTFDTLSVTELFGLLSTASKTGALRLEAGDHEAAVFVRAGRCCAVESADAGEGLPADAGGLAARLVDVGFALARQPAGSFRFADAEAPTRRADVEVALEPAVAEITEMLAAWHDIEATIPSLDARLRLAPVLRDDEIVLRVAEWAVLVALEPMPTVRELVALRGEPLLEVCRLVKDLVDRGAVEVAAAREPATAAGAPVRRAERRDDRRAALEAATAGILDPMEPYAPEAVEPEPEPVRVAADPPRVVVWEPAAEVREPVAVPEPVGARAAAEPASDEPSADRGALLRLFSALKEN